MVLAAALASAPALADPPSRPFLDELDAIKLVGSTMPTNGDINPYGVVVIEKSVGMLERGNILVSNFNAASNLQGTGTTIVQITPAGSLSVFAEIDPAGMGKDCPGGVGLTTALVVLRRGWVVVGSLPTADGSSATAKQGCLMILDSGGNVVETLSGDLLKGPWDMTAADGDDVAALFVSTVLNGDVLTPPIHEVDEGTVVRIDLLVPKAGKGMPLVQSMTVIGSGFPETADPAALIIGPTGLGLGKDETLYVADSLGNRIARIADALKRMTSADTGVEVTHGGALNDPLGLAIAPNGDILTANGGDGNLVETTPEGSQVAVKTVETVTGAGSLFGIALVPHKRGVYFVDDGDNTLKALVRSKGDEHDDEGEDGND
jgi:sugar lactone lactonase YvrE